MLKILGVFFVGLLAASHPAFSQQQAWYEGGTLQKATVAQWASASSENQLATAGDFIASISGIADLSKVTDQATANDIKKRAEDLQVCVNQTAQVNPTSEQPVAELIVRCTILKPKE